MKPVATRAAHLLAVLLLATFATFSIVDLIPGDAAAVIAGDDATPSQVAAIQARLELDRPMLTRYGTWLWHVLQGDLGRSYISNQSVMGTLADRLPVSLEIAIISQALALAIAIPWGLYSAFREDGIFDRISSAVGFAGVAIPSFVLGLGLIYIFAGGFTSVLPATGYVPLTEDLVQNLRTITLPCLCLVPLEAAVYRQVLRSDAISTLRENYVLLAKSKGLSPQFMLVRHVLRPSSLSLITLSGLSIGRLIGGSVIIETMFAVPGVGQLVVQSVTERDYIMLQGALLLISVVYVAMNMLVDVGYAIVDPRVRNK